MRHFGLQLERVRKISSTDRIQDTDRILDIVNNCLGGVWKPGMHLPPLLFQTCEPKEGMTKSNQMVDKELSSVNEKHV